MACPLWGRSSGELARSYEVRQVMRLGTLIVNLLLLSLIELSDKSTYTVRELKGGNDLPN